MFAYTTCPSHVLKPTMPSVFIVTKAVVVFPAPDIVPDDVWLLVFHLFADDERMRIVLGTTCKYFKRLIDDAPCLWRHVTLRPNRLGLQSYRTYLGKCVANSSGRHMNLTIGTQSAPVYESGDVLRWFPNVVMQFADVICLRLFVSSEIVDMLMHSSVLFRNVEDITLCVFSYDVRFFDWERPLTCFSESRRLRCLKVSNRGAVTFHGSLAELLPFPTDNLEFFESMSFFATTNVHQLMERSPKLKRVVFDASCSSEPQHDFIPAALLRLEHLEEVDMTLSHVADSRIGVAALLQSLVCPNLVRFRMDDLMDVDDATQEAFDNFASSSFERLQELELDSVGFFLLDAVHHTKNLRQLTWRNTFYAGKQLVDHINVLSHMPELRHVFIYGLIHPRISEGINSDVTQAFEDACANLRRLMDQQDGDFEIDFCLWR
ncbi:hypothetical protein FISHEDRAFT_78166 [Fistulina hepatica ATCC 64428]|nr:hypothetical protein FISHEDRAFT_78166 [Fistulina hepatica ATCC 64428]